MEACKSCAELIDVNSKYCGSCGGKIVEDRLSLKGTWQEFIGPFFSWDYNFWKTINHLIIKPDLVLNAYVSGGRKKYFNPFSFLVVYASIALLFYKFYPLDLSSEFSNGLGNTQPAVINPVEVTQQINSNIYSYYNFWVVLLLPFNALLAYFSLKKQNHNFSEHLVFQAYIQTFLGYFAILSQVVIVSVFGLGFPLYLYTYFIVAFLYTNYVFFRMYNYRIKAIILANVKFLVGLIFSMVILILFGVLYGAFVY